MRIIGGQWRSQKLRRPASLRTRPVSDRVKESVFNILGCWYETPGLIPAVTALDLFSGSGAFGFEALSRGASSTCFVERDHAAASVIRQNIRHLKCEDQAMVIQSDAWRGPSTWAMAQGPADLLFLDPPFPDGHGKIGFDRVAALLAKMAHDQCSANDALLMFRHDKNLTIEQAPTGWRLVDQRVIGRSVLSFMQRTSDDAQVDLAL